MSGFSAAWLALREPADHRARNAELLAAVAAHVHDRDAVAVLDLASGRGSTLRAVAPHLPARQRWTLVDRDADLLADARRLAAGDGVPVALRQADLRTDLAAVMALPADLLTTSAFFDLVSDAWLARLVDLAAARRLPVYAALSYDGRMACRPADPHDDACVAAFNRHQRRDKGLGPALGPDATARAEALFRAAGYRVAIGPSDWRLGSETQELQRQLIDGWHAAVAETDELTPDALAAWHAGRRAAIDAGGGLMVGHLDLWAVPE